MESLSGELKKRMDQRPDQWTLSWWNERFQEVLKAYRGLAHANACVLAENEDLAKKVEALVEFAKAAEADRAKIGELQARVERMAEFLNKMKNGGKPSDS